MLYYTLNLLIIIYIYTCCVIKSVLFDGSSIFYSKLSNFFKLGLLINIFDFYAFTLRGKKKEERVYNKQYVGMINGPSIFHVPMKLNHSV